MDQKEKGCYINSRELPAGLRLALAHNAEALACFSRLNGSQRRLVVDRARAVRSFEGMQLYVAQLGRSE